MIDTVRATYPACPDPFATFANGALGWYVGTVVLRVELDGSWTARDNAVDAMGDVHEGTDLVSAAPWFARLNP